MTVPSRRYEKIAVFERRPLSAMDRIWWNNFSMTQRLGHGAQMLQKTLNLNRLRWLSMYHVNLQVDSLGIYGSPGPALVEKWANMENP